MVFVELAKDSKGRHIVGIICQAAAAVGDGAGGRGGGAMVYCCNGCNGEFGDVQKCVEHLHTAKHSDLPATTVATSAAILTATAVVQRPNNSGRVPAADNSIGHNPNQNDAAAAVARDQNLRLRRQSRQSIGSSSNRGTEQTTCLICHHDYSCSQAYHKHLSTKKHEKNALLALPAAATIHNDRRLSLQQQLQQQQPQNQRRNSYPMPIRTVNVKVEETTAQELVFICSELLLLNLCHTFFITSFFPCTCCCRNLVQPMDDFVDDIKDAIDDDDNDDNAAVAEEIKPEHDHNSE